MSRRRVTKRVNHLARRNFWNRQADALLAHAESIWQQADGFDTAVRDSIAEGLAYIVNAAFDCRANAMEFSTVEEWSSFIDFSTAGWFRARGFFEWFCGATAALFHSTPPRHLIQSIKFKGQRRPPRNSRARRKSRKAKKS